ncbi:MAG: DUF5652 family protein [Candidatus Nomurabacteria bacterium]|nr:DUF5652 family protein [Candidatus Nomurabacteria bacterium]
MEQYNQFITNTSLPLIILVAIWTLFWKGYALWTASKNDHKKWFIAILIFNTVGILEIIYIFKFAKKSWADVKEVMTMSISSKK